VAKPLLYNPSILLSGFRVTFTISPTSKDLYRYVWYIVLGPGRAAIYAKDMLKMTVYLSPQLQLVVLDMAT